MPRVSQLFFKTAVIFLIAGIGLGLYMGMSGDHRAFTAHAHINLLGWVSSAIFGGYYALNPAAAGRGIAMAHYVIYTIGLIVMLPALYLMFGKEMTFLEPLVGIGSLIVALGIAIFAVIVFTTDGNRAAAR
jgi:drug/metabolite transporter (DMT)-like permease